jgi:hypothetical protein
LAQYRDKQRREFFNCDRSLIKHTFGEVEDIFSKYSDEQIAKLYNLKLIPYKKKTVVNKNDNRIDAEISIEEIEIEIEIETDEDYIIDDEHDMINGNNIINIYGDVNIITKKIYCCEKCKTIYSKKYNYEKHMSRKTPCVPEEKEKYDFERLCCQYCSKVLATVYSCQNHMRTCKYKPDVMEQVEELKQIVYELSNKLINVENKIK